MVYAISINVSNKILLKVIHALAPKVKNYRQNITKVTHVFSPEAKYRFILFGNVFYTSLVIKKTCKNIWNLNTPLQYYHNFQDFYLTLEHEKKANDSELLFSETEDFLRLPPWKIHRCTALAIT